MRKTILDACCGGKMFYFDKHDERVLFQDIRNVSTHLCDGRSFEVNPDIQADFTNMPYEDKSFSLIKECWKVKDGRYVRKFERKSIANRLPTN